MEASRAFVANPIRPVQEGIGAMLEAMMLRGALSAISTMFGSLGVFFDCMSFVKPALAVYAVVFSQRRDGDSARHGAGRAPPAIGAAPLRNAAGRLDHSCLNTPAARRM